MKSDHWKDVVEHAARGVQALRAGLEAELAHELQRASHGDVIGLARGFARFEILAAQQCREAATVLDRVRRAPLSGLASEEQVLLERLVELGHALQSDCRRGLVLLRDRMAQTANDAVEWTAGRLEKALEDFGKDPVARPRVRDSGATWPMAVARSEGNEA